MCTYLYTCTHVKITTCSFSSPSVVDVLCLCVDACFFMCGHTWQWGCTCVCKYTRRTESFFIALPSYSLRQVSQANPELTDKGSLTSQLALGILSSPSETGITCSLPHPPSIHIGFWDPNPGPHAYVVCTQSLEPPSQPHCLFLNRSMETRGS